MKTLYAELSPYRLGAMQVLGRISKGAHFGPLAPLREADITLPPLPGPRYVRIRNRLAGICGSDLHFVYAEGDLRIAPAALPGRTRVYMGHEIASEIVEVGSEVTEYKVGDRVTWERGSGNCMAREDPSPCQHCAVGNYSRCEKVGEGEDDLSVGGGWSEEWITRVGSLYHVPDDITDEQAVLMEPAACGLRPALRRRAQPGDKVLVIGCGTIGLMTLQSIRAVQPDCEITALAQFRYQAEMAKKLGAEHIIMLGQDAYAAVARLTGGKLYTGWFKNRTIAGGFDMVYDCVGKPNTLRDALRWTRAGGTVVLVGVYLAPMRIDLTPVWYHEVDLIGMLGHGAEEWEGQRISTYDLVVRLLREGKLNFDGFITHRFPLSQYREAISTAVDPGRNHSFKVVFDHQKQASEGGRSHG